MGEVIRIMKS